VQATYLGGAGGESLHGLALAGGALYATGITSSTAFPAVAGGAQGAKSGAVDAYVARLAPSLQALSQATYYGGVGNELVYDVKVHPTSGDVYIAGQTPSANVLPGTTGGAQPTFGGGNADAFVARFNGTLTALLQATYYGGSSLGSSDGVDARVAIHPVNGDVYLAGQTSSNLLGTTGGAQPARNLNNDAFVARFNPALTGIVQATYLGGSDDDPGVVIGIAIHPSNGDVYVAGQTRSIDLPARSGGAQAAHGGGGGNFDAFVTRLNPALTAFVQSTYYGGASDESDIGLAISPLTGNVYVSGATGGSLPNTSGGAQAGFAGNADAFVVAITPDLVAAAGIPPTITTASPLAAGTTGVAYSTPVVASGTAPVTFTITSGVPPPGLALATNGTLSGVPTAAGTFNFSVSATNAFGTDTDPFAVVVAPAAGDTTPDPFAFTDVTGVPLSSLVTSNTVAITGIDAPTPISITGGAYSIGCTLAFVTSPATVAPGQTICVRHTSSATAATATNTVLTIGGMSDTFTSITVTGGAPPPPPPPPPAGTPLEPIPTLGQWGLIGLALVLAMLAAGSLRRRL
jgi:hypothetical protein